MLFSVPALDLEDGSVLEEIGAMRADLAAYLRTPRRWQGRLRRTALARAIRGSNSIEGIHVELDDADAALDDDEPLSADQRTFAEVRGYRQALGFVLAMGGDPHFVPDAAAMRSMHFMMLSHDLSKSPGQYRRSEIFVQDEQTGENVYEGPPPEMVPALMEELADGLQRPSGTDPLVLAAMSHLNLVMIHPFRDGNGRMSRALQTLVLARSGIGEPEFASVEEWLGAHTPDYYRALAVTGDGAWHPENDAHLWVKFMLRAHHLQAQTVARRVERTEAAYREISGVVVEQGLPDRVLDALYAGLVGYRVTRPTYVRQSLVDERTASRDLRTLLDLGLLAAHGETRGRYYVRGPRLEETLQRLGPRARPVDPMPWLPAELLRRTSGRTGAPQEQRTGGTSPRTDRSMTA